MNREENNKFNFNGWVTKWREHFENMVKGLLEAAVHDQDLVDALPGGLDQRLHQMQRSVAAFLPTAQHAGVLDAHRLAAERPGRGEERRGEERRERDTPHLLSLRSDEEAQQHMSGLHGTSSEVQKRLKAG